ncbi:response regulator [Vibrio aestuarianus]|uniref:response regulator n=1 Tax=Vibrio aestuarianus TaxID=28171 RepID=UPI00237D06D2|nr:response regulator [Vibrio aestuarianus]MDE1337302.1 response regulator [Vibrio aestuarianus]
MKLKYNIIWIDDQISLVRGDRRIISGFFRSKEIELDLISIEANAGSSLVENKDFIKALDSKELDFILIDYNMPGLNGSDVIEYIRKTLHDYHTPILFYTGDDPLDLSNAINSKNSDGVEFIDGIFYCHRDNISDKFLKIVNSQLRNDEKINSVRGMLMDRVGYVDHCILRALEHCKDSVLEGSRSRVSNQIKSRLRRKKSSLEQALENIEDWTYDDVITFLKDNPRLTDCHTRAESLREMLKKSEALRHHGEILSDFYNGKDGGESLNNLRNIYAHEPCESISAIHTEDNIKLLRAETKKHISNIETLLGIE